MFELLEHTADIGFRARGRTLEELFEASAEALSAIAVELAEIEPRETYPIEAAGEDSEALLVDWLNEVLWLLDGRHVLMSRFRVTRIESGRVQGEGLGERYDAGRHRAKLVVKGVTYHQLSVRREGDGWIAEVFLDI